MTAQVRMGRYPHIGWVDLEGNGIQTEVAVMQNNEKGLFFIQLNFLDSIDKQRIIRIISSRNNGNLPLWDLMSQITLGNGANALDFFHQYVRILTPMGNVITPRVGKVSTGIIRTTEATTQQTVTTETVTPPVVAKKTTTKSVSAKK